MKEEIIKADVPSDWNLNDPLMLKYYYRAIEKTFKDYEILGFIKFPKNKTKVILKKC